MGGDNNTIGTLYLYPLDQFTLDSSRDTSYICMDSFLCACMQIQSHVLPNALLRVKSYA